MSCLPMRKINKTAMFHVGLNKLYVEFNDQRGYFDSDTVIAFSAWLRERYGIEIRIHPKVDPLGKAGYEVKEVWVVDEKKYTWYLLETA